MNCLMCGDETGSVIIGGICAKCKFQQNDDAFMMPKDAAYDTEQKAHCLRCGAETAMVDQNHHCFACGNREFQVEKNVGPGTSNIITNYLIPEEGIEVSYDNPRPEIIERSCLRCGEKSQILDDRSWCLKCQESVNEVKKEIQKETIKAIHKDGRGNCKHCDKVLDTGTRKAFVWIVGMVGKSKP